MILKMTNHGHAFTDKDVLDLGCGSGILTKKIKNLGARSVTGLDLSDELIQIAKKENPDLNFKQGSVLQTPFADSSFDQIVSALVMHYISDVGVFFRECFRLLNPRGQMFFTFHHPVMEVFEAREGGVILKPTYFEENSYEWQIGDQTLLSYHHTFSSVINKLIEQGFQLDLLLESKADESFRSSEPEFYQRAGLYPSFAGIRAVKNQ